MLEVNPHVAGKLARYDRQDAFQPWHPRRRAPDPDGIDRFRDGAGHIQLLTAA